MLNQHEIERYKRQISLGEIGYSGQIKIQNAKVLIVGAGGLGCPVAQYIASAGIGKIGLLDGDRISLSNLPRQILFSSNEIGRLKVEVVKEKLFQLNENVETSIFPEFLNADLAFKIFSEYDLIVDCTDNFEARYIINDVCVALQKPFVSSAIYHFEGQIGFYNILQSDGLFSCNYRDVYPEIPDSTAHVNCNEGGVMASLPGLMGLYQANEILKYFVNKKMCLTNQLLFVNVWNMQHMSLEIEKNAQQVPLTKEEILNFNYAGFCSNSYDFEVLSSKDLQDISSEVLWIDVREKGEEPTFKNDMIKQLPLSIIENKWNELHETNSMLFFCKSGARSARAAKLIKEKYPDKRIYNYAGDIKNIIELFNAKRELV